LHGIEYGELRPLGADRDVLVDARIIATSNVPLGSLVEEGKFLPDLYSRLLVFRVTVPSLRERRADIPQLVRDSVAFRAPRCGYKVAPVVHAELMQALMRAEWPYNLRQLDATVHRLLIEADLAPELTLELCRGNLAYLRKVSPSKANSESTPALEQLIKGPGGVSGAARLLGVDRTTIYRRLERQQRRDD
jgi:DNA-binding NtrC family response regulator